MTPRADAYVDDHSHYPDTGCEDGGPSCLACPLARCVHDEKRMGGTPREPERNAEIIAAWRAGGVTFEDLAARYGLSRRTILRVTEVARRA